MKLYSRLFVILPLVMGFCATSNASDDELAKVGNTTIKKAQFDAFQKVIRIYPSKQDDYFPGRRSATTFMLESEILSSKASSDLKKELEKSADWQWKKVYYPAQLYLIDVLAQNLGTSDEELSKYYTDHKDSFKMTIKPSDPSKKDSVYYKTFDESREEIANKLFLKDNKPDAAFLKSFGDTLPPNDKINQDWISYIRSNVPQYFMKKFYKEDYGKSFSDSLSDFFGKGKLITQEDMDVILSWIPEERRESFKSPQGNKELAEWLLKWKLFSARAEKTGFSKTPIIMQSLDCAWKIELATQYVNKTIVSKIKPSNKIDTLIAKYAIADEASSANLKPDTTQLDYKIKGLRTQLLSLSVDSAIYSARKSANIKFLQDSWKDTKAQTAAKLLAKADSLRDSAKTDEAEQLYASLADEYGFTPEGKKAIIEQAKLQTERQSYYQAISNYRKYLLLGDDKSKFCNNFFMIGFIYDEYLDRPELAEINYKYILKNLQGCDLTDDAEFMMLHLGEPMSSVEELQAEALRQGRKVDATPENNAAKAVPVSTTNKKK